jgi:hypothetical protein
MFGGCLCHVARGFLPDRVYLFISEAAQRATREICPCLVEDSAAVSSVAWLPLALLPLVPLAAWLLARQRRSCEPL